MGKKIVPTKDLPKLCGRGDATRAALDVRTGRASPAQRKAEQSAIGGDGCVEQKNSSDKRLAETMWQGRRDSNTQPAVLETAALPIEPLP